MKITFLGTGTSTGVPVLTCKCEVCQSLDFRDKRLRVSILIEINGKSILIDAGPDFRQQALREKIKHLEAVVFTHEHHDHTGGLDDIRPFNYLSGIKQMPIYAHSRVLDQLKKEYYYAFEENAYPGVPLIQCHTIENKEFEIEGIKFTPIEVLHHKLQVFGFRIGRFAYITDANFIAENELKKLQNLDILVLNALQKKKHLSHFNLEEAIEMTDKIGARKTYLTHISHNMGKHINISKEVPQNVEFAYDGLQIWV